MPPRLSRWPTTLLLASTRRPLPTKGNRRPLRAFSKRNGKTLRGFLVYEVVLTLTSGFRWKRGKGASSMRYLWCLVSIRAFFRPVMFGFQSTLNSIILANP